MPSNPELVLESMWRIADGNMFDAPAGLIAKATGKRLSEVSHAIHRLIADDAITQLHRGHKSSQYRLLTKVGDYRHERTKVEVKTIWTGELTDRLRALWDTGHSTAEIGRKLKMTKNSIVGRAHRLDLPARPSPIRRDAFGPPTRRVALRRVTGSTIPRLASAASEARETPDAPVTSPILAALHDIRESRPVITARPVKPPNAPRSLPLDFRSSAPARPATPRPATYISPGKCRFPMWGNGPPTHKYCDAAISVRSYCAVHAKICYVVIRDRREDIAE